MRTVIVSMIAFYQYAVSPLLGCHCRFEPSCSHYARQAVMRYGLRRGGMMAATRLLRCQPFGAHGIDPVP